MNSKNFNNIHHKTKSLCYSCSADLGGSVKLFDNLEWLTTAEAAHYLRKSKAAIRQMVCRGQLKARKFHRRLYFRKVELDQALDISFY